jgi:acyl-CoA synthetase (AMP-forming)/AMP-acid ligase II
MAIDEKDVFLPIVPLCHSFGFVCGFLTALKCNATIVITDSILPRNIIQACNKHNVTILLGVQHFYEKMMDLSDSYKFNKGMRYLITSCGILDSELKTDFENKFKICMTQMYGSTETGCLAISRKEDEANFLSIMFEGVDFIIKEDINGIPWIYVKTLETHGSYLKSNPFKNLKEEYIKMGDIGAITEDNRLHILGRGDDVVIVSGKKTSIKTINNVLEKNPDLVDFKLYKDKESGELICKYVSDFEPHLIRKFCRQYLQEYQIPKHFYKVDSIQKNNMSWKNCL